MESKIYGYCRVSTENQSLRRQVNNIIEVYPNVDKFFMDKCTGTTINRPEWNRLMRQLKSGDTIIFDSISRMSRNVEEGIKQYETLYHQKITLIFLNEPYCNTENYRQASEASITSTGNEIIDVYIEATNKVIMLLAKKQIELAFAQAEKEHADLCKRIKDGMKAAQVQAMEEGRKLHFGVRTGSKLITKKSISSKKMILKHSKTFGGSLNDSECLRLIGISRNTYYKYKRELLEEIHRKERKTQKCEQ